MERLSRDGVMLCFEDIGKGAPPVLLIHDPGSDHTWLQPQVEYFQALHRVVAVDLPAHGQTDGHQAPGTAAARFADDLAWICYESGLYRPVAIGHGQGALIAFNLAVRYPDLIAAVVLLAGPYRSATVADALVSEASVLPLASNVSLLYIVPDPAGADADRLRELCPHAVVKVVVPDGFNGCKMDTQANYVIEQFLNEVYRR